MKRWKITLSANESIRNNTGTVSFSTSPGNQWNWNFNTDCQSLFALNPCTSSDELLAGYVTDGMKTLFEEYYLTDQPNTIVSISGNSLGGTRKLSISFDVEDDDEPEWVILSSYVSVTAHDVTVIDPPGGSLVITSVSHTPDAADPCNYFKVTVLANETFNSITSPTQNYVPDVNTVSFYLERGGGTYLITINKNIDGEGEVVANKSVYYNIPKWTEEDITAITNGVMTTITVKVPDLIFEYSDRPILEGAFYPNNVFILPVGNNNIHVRDQWGCVVTKNVVIEPNNEATILYIPKANSLRFKIVNELLINDENTFSCETQEEYNHADRQMFNIGDVITTQIKSSYRPSFSIVSSGGSGSRPVRKITEYMNNHDCLTFSTTIGLDGTSYDYLTFTNSKLFVCGSDTVIKDTPLEYGLPLWAKVGQQILVTDVDTSVRVILGTGKDSNGVPYIKVDRLATSPPVDPKLEVHYNIEEYEVWESDFTISKFGNDTQLYIYINTPDGIVTAISETYNSIAKNDRDKWTKIEYWMNKNTDMYYNSGIRNLSYQLVLSSELELDLEIENYKTDTNVLQLDEKFYSLDKFTFDVRSKEIARNLALALTHNNVLINDIFYTAKSISIEKKGGSNLYSVELIAYKRGDDLYINQYTDTNPLGVDLIKGMPNQFIIQ